jgi:hypothetical protein
LVKYNYNGLYKLGNIIKNILLTGTSDGSGVGEKKYFATFGKEFGKSTGWSLFK